MKTQSMEDRLAELPQIEPSPELWGRIQGQLRKDELPARRSLTPWLIAASVLAFGFSALFYLNVDVNQATESNFAESSEVVDGISPQLIESMTEPLPTLTEAALIHRLVSLESQLLYDTELSQEHRATLERRLEQTRPAVEFVLTNANAQSQARAWY